MYLLYLDSTRCDVFPVPRLRPAIREWKTISMKHRENIEIKSGGFGLLPKQDDVCIDSLESKVLFSIIFFIIFSHMKKLLKYYII